MLISYLDKTKMAAGTFSFFWKILPIILLCNICISVNQNFALRNLKWFEINRLLFNIANSGLYARSLRDKLETEFKWSEKEVDLMKLLAERKSELDGVFKSKTQQVKKLRDLVIKYYSDFKITKPGSHCCYQKDESTQNRGCFTGKGLNVSLIATLPPKMLERMEEIKSVYASNNLLYFALLDGGMYTSPSPMTVQGQLEHCLLFEAHKRPWYELARSPVPRDVVIFVDEKAFRNPITRDTGIATAQEVIESLTQEDKFAVLDKINLKENYKHSRHIRFGVWLAGTYRNKHKIISLTKNMTFDDSSQDLDHHLNSRERVKGAKRMFQSPIQFGINITKRAERIVVQIVSGPMIPCLNSSLWKEEGLPEPIIITYVIGVTEATHKEHCRNESIEHYVVNIEKIEDLKDENKKFMNFFTWSKYLKKYSSLDPYNDIRITLPYSSYANQAIIISFILPIVINGQFVGAAGCDISKLITLEQVTKLGTKFQDSYGFLIDESGRALSHPLLPSAYCTKQVNGHILCQHPTYEIVSHLEQNEHVLDILQSMVRMEKGNRTIDGHYIQSTGHALDDEQENPVKITKRKLAYAWVPLESIRVSLCIVIPIHNEKIYAVTYMCVDERRCEILHIAYHLLVDQLGSQNCILFGADVVKDRGLVKFAPLAFQDPFDYINQKSATDVVLNAIRNGKDFRTYLRGENLSPSVVATEIAENIWRSEKDAECFMGVRFLGTTTGVFISYPGISLNATYDHRLRTWYQLAVANRQPYPTISLTVPYKDFFSGRKVISVATPVEMTMDSGSSFLVGVLGGDFSVEFLAKQFQKRLPQCDSHVLSCFLIDSMGYIVLHLNKKIMSSSHITQAYPSVAHDLVSSDLLLRQGCHDYEKDVVFLYWIFRLPDGVTTFFTNGPPSNRVVVHKIPYTNVFLMGMLGEGEEEEVKKEEVKKKKAPDCLSTCSKRVESPCKVALKVECKEGEDEDGANRDMRSSFDQMPPCFPSDIAPSNNKAKTTCQTNSDNNNTCYKSTRIKSCSQWEPNCFQEG